MSCVFQIVNKTCTFLKGIAMLSKTCTFLKGIDMLSKVIQEDFVTMFNK